MMRTRTTRNIFMLNFTGSALKCITQFYSSPSSRIIANLIYNAMNYSSNCLLLLLYYFTRSHFHPSFWLLRLLRFKTLSQLKDNFGIGGGSYLPPPPIY